MPASEKPLHIDIPVKLSDVKVVFSVDALAFEGDLPASIFHMQLIKNDIASWSATSEIVAVFHTKAGHVSTPRQRPGRKGGTDVSRATDHGEVTE